MVLLYFSSSNIKLESTLNHGKKEQKKGSFDNLCIVLLTVLTLYMTEVVLITIIYTTFSSAEQV